MQKIIPFLWFNDQAEQATQLYTSVFQNSSLDDVARYGPDMPLPEGQVMLVNFRLAGQEFMALNGGPEFDLTPAISFFVTCQSEAEIDKLWASLGQGGHVFMELGAYPFSQKFGWLADRFGVSWQFSLTETPQTIAPYLLFVGAQQGKAEEAARFYTELFKNSSITHLQRYGPDMGEPEGTLMVGSFQLAGQPFMAADSSLAHAFTFTPAISFYVNCADQAEVDYFWDRLTAGGEESQCGWLVDRYGVSWQIIPTALGQLMGDPDPEKAYRVTQAMLQMQKIVISQLQQAYERA